MTVDNQLAGPGTGFVDLIEGFPSRGGKSGSYDTDAVSRRIFSRPQKPELEAFEAASSPLRLVLQAPNRFQPVLMVVIGIHNLQPERLRIAGALILTNLIFLTGIYVRIAVIYDWSHSMLHQTFDDRAGAWGATGVEQDLRLSKRHLEYFLFL